MRKWASESHTTTNPRFTVSHESAALEYTGGSGRLTGHRADQLPWFSHANSTMPSTRLSRLSGMSASWVANGACQPFSGPCSISTSAPNSQ